MEFFRANKSSILGAMAIATIVANPLDNGNESTLGIFNISAAEAKTTCRIQRNGQRVCIRRMQSEQRRFVSGLKHRGRLPEHKLNCSNVERDQERLLARARSMRNKTTRDCVRLCNQLQVIVDRMKRCGYGHIVRAWARPGAGLDRSIKMLKCNQIGVHIQVK